ncbi:MAG: hypothetical protein CBHOC_5411, partial [uncultured Caballeronia sp.]
MLLSYLEKVPRQKAHLPQRGRHTLWGTTDTSIRSACAPDKHLTQYGRMHPHLTKLQRIVSRLATVNQTEVCSLSRGMMSQPRPGASELPTILLTVLFVWSEELIHLCDFM